MADLRFYAFFDTHLNYLAYEYIGEGNLFSDLVTADPQFIFFMTVWGLGSTGLYFTISKTYKLFSLRETNIPIIRKITFFLIFTALFFLGARGRVGLSPMDWGIAFNSQNHLMNQLPLNGVYTFFKSYIEEDHDPRLCYLNEDERFEFVEFSYGINEVQTVLEQEDDRWAYKNYSLERISNVNKAKLDFNPNIIIVISEGWSSRNTGSLGASHNLTPYFDAVALNGLLFTNYYASGTRTNYGLGAILCSFPSLPGRAIIKRYHANHPFVTLPELLNERGYYNCFAYGGDYVFDNLEGFFKQKKYDRFFGVSDFGSEHEFSKWGIPDHVLFEKMVDRLDSLPRPFQLTFLTLSNHEPFDLPDSSVRQFMNDSDSAKHFNAQLYADYSIGRFMAMIDKMPLKDSTIFIFTSDHTRYKPGQHFLEPDNFHIPFLIYAPFLNFESKRIETFSGQVDIIPTLMGLLGGKYYHSSWGRDLLNLKDDDNGFAIFNASDRIGYIDKDHIYIEKLGFGSHLFKPEDFYNNNSDTTSLNVQELLRIQKFLHTYLQIADQLSTPQLNN